MKLLQSCSNYLPYSFVRESDFRVFHEILPTGFQDCTIVDAAYHQRPWYILTVSHCQKFKTGLSFDPTPTQPDPAPPFRHFSSNGRTYILISQQQFCGMSENTKGIELSQIDILHRKSKKMPTWA
jgi:hypothetical protein